ncbi:MAG: 16S rRNA (cytosine(1402)-N(4))-methyltransferase RsmH [Candidatus Eremiobacteraeota bacterium]|nr:16S rRNA (cytosine(1402)-N(4))-methyltransferase RsmH [Candidatus Eremiobacteraeota bacterium]
MHVSVLLDEALTALAVRPGGVYVDATFGAGGHARAILARLGPRGRLVGLDLDPSVVTQTEIVDPRLVLVRANFRDLCEALGELEIATLDGILFDLGVSSMQLDSGERGFSFQSDAPLDMRMDPTHGPTAAEYLVHTGERELADTIFRYGEEPRSRAIARALKREPPHTTAELAHLVSRVYRGKRGRIHPATRTFQALRIAVNDELASLEIGLDAAASVLRPGGRLVAIAFHSLEDRIVKNHLRGDARLRSLFAKPIVASDDERNRNPRARSAKLRAAERVPE